MAAFVLQADAQQVTAQNPVISYPLGTTDGSLLVIFFSWANTSGAVSSIIDTLGDAWTQIDFSQVSGTLRTIYCFATQTEGGGSTSVTISTDQSRTYSMSYFEVVGASINLDGSPIHTNFGTGQGTAPLTGQLTTQVQGSVVFAYTKCGAISNDPPEPPWETQDTNNSSAAYQITTSPGTFQAQWTAASSNWATTILAFQMQPGPGIVIGPYPLISDLPAQVGTLATPANLASNVVQMVSYRSTWHATQPSKPSAPTSNPLDSSYNWTFLDQAVQQATQFQKLISFHIAVQAFGTPQWVKNNAVQYIDSGGDSISLYWDSFYQSYLIAFIQAMGSRYGANPALYKTVWTIMSTGGSWNVPHTATDIAALTAAPYNYTTALAVGAQEAITAAAAAAFPTSFIQLQVGTSGQLDITPGGPIHRYNAATQMSQYGYSHYASQFAMDRDGFNPYNPLPQQALSSQDQSSWYLLAQPTTGSANTSGTSGTIPQGARVFGQADWPAVDQTGQYTAASTNNFKANGGVPYSNPGPVVQATITMMRAYYCVVAEIYDQDVQGVLIPATRPPWGVGLLGRHIALISPTSDIINPGFNV